PPTATTSFTHTIHQTKNRFTLISSFLGRAMRMAGGERLDSTKEQFSLFLFSIYMVGGWCMGAFSEVGPLLFSYY
ncbi:MAG: hypothetical protein ACREHC_02515, partial [Candidatus Levyibacteriota bacterium]